MYPHIFMKNKKWEAIQSCKMYQRTSVDHPLVVVVLLSTLNLSAYATVFSQVDGFFCWCGWINSHRFDHRYMIHDLYLCSLRAFACWHGWFLCWICAPFADAHSFNGWAAALDAFWGEDPDALRQRTAREMRVLIGSIVSKHDANDEILTNVNANAKKMPHRRLQIRYWIAKNCGWESRFSPSELSSAGGCGASDEWRRSKSRIKNTRWYEDEKTSKGVWVACDPMIVLPMLVFSACVRGVGRVYSLALGCLDCKIFFTCIIVHAFTLFPSHLLCTYRMKSICL